MANDSVFDDMMQALYEVEEYQKGNINLKTNIIDLPDSELEFFHNYNNLSENEKNIVQVLVSGLLKLK